MASGHVNRTQRPNTWLHRPSLRREDSPCQLGAVHTWPFAADVASYLFGSYRSNSGHAGRTDADSKGANDPTATSTDTITFPRRRFFGYLVGRCRIHDNALNHNWTSQDRRSIHSASLLSDKREPNMNDTTAYTPPEVWVWEREDSPKWRYRGDRVR